MNRTIRIGKNIYPDLDTMDEVNKVLKERFEIEIGFLFDDGVEFIFDEPQRAVAKGQFAVAYDGDICLGGGEITDILRN